MLSLEWRPVGRYNKTRVSSAKIQYHVAIQNVAAIGRRFLGESKGDLNASLFWIPGLSRMAGRWIKGKITFRSSISFLDFSIYLVDDRVNTISSFSIKGSTHRKIMLWLEEQIGKLGLSASELMLKLPYQMKNYPQLSGEVFDLDDQLATDELSNYFHNSYLVLRALKSKLNWKEEILIWPHHFDLAIKIILKDTGDPETDTLITLGMMPGDDEDITPYFYVSTWPHVHTSKMDFASKAGNLIEDEWTGTRLSMDELSTYKFGEQEDVLCDFYERSYSLLVESLTK